MMLGLMASAPRLWLGNGELWVMEHFLRRFYGDKTVPG